MSPVGAALCVKGMLRATELACTVARPKRLTNSFLGLLLEVFGASAGLMQGLGRRRTKMVLLSQHECELQQANRAMIDHVADLGVAVAARHDGRPVACVPLFHPGKHKVRGCVYLVRIAKGEVFTVPELEALALLASVMMLGLSRLVPKAGAKQQPVVKGKRQPDSKGDQLRVATVTTFQVEDSSTDPSSMTVTHSGELANDLTQTSVRVPVRSSPGQKGKKGKRKTVPLTLGLLFDGIPDCLDGWNDET